MSHPMWVRGLKLLKMWCRVVVVRVAPYVGAWIETKNSPCYLQNCNVAPYVGAWIETSVCALCCVS